MEETEATHIKQALTDDVELSSNVVVGRVAKNL
jgi:hypothetical protein